MASRAIVKKKILVHMSMSSLKAGSIKSDFFFFLIVVHKWQQCSQEGEFPYEAVRLHVKLTMELVLPGFNFFSPV